MRPRFGIFRLLAAVIVLAAVGIFAYNLGWSNGVATHLPAGAAGAPPYYYGAPFGAGLGFGFFGFLWFLLILFGVFWILRLAFFGRRYWGGGWGGWGPGGGPGNPGPTREERMREWHRRAHGEAPSTPSGQAPPAQAQ
jgi:hypothetical protein